MKPAVLALLALAVTASAQQTTCSPGQYLSNDGLCRHDQTGERHPSGDGCNAMTCMDPACHNSSTTLAYCAQPDDPAVFPLQPETAQPPTPAQEPRFPAPNVRLGDVAVPKPQPRVFVVDQPPPMTTTTNRDFAVSGPMWLKVASMQGPIATCEMAEDGKRVHDCKIADGHTLDEVMQVWVDQSRETSEAFDAEMREWMRQWQIIRDILGGKPATRKVVKPKKQPPANP